MWSIGVMNLTYVLIAFSELKKVQRATEAHQACLDAAVGQDTVGVAWLGAASVPRSGVPMPRPLLIGDQRQKGEEDGAEMYGFGDRSIEVRRFKRQIVQEVFLQTVQRDPPARRTQLIG